MSSNDPLLLLKVNRIISDITARVNTSAVEILEIVSKYEDELRLAKEEIERQRKLLEAVPKQHGTTLASDVQCSELHLSVSEQKIPPEQLLRDEEASQSNKSHLSVCSLEIVYEDELCLAQEIERQRKLFEAVPKQHGTTQTLTSDVQCSELHLSVSEQKIPPKQLIRNEETSQSNKSQLSVCSLTSRQFEELTKSHETGKEDYPYSCHGGEYERPLETHDFVSQIDLVQIKEEEEPMSIHVGEEGFQSTLDATEDHTATSDSSQSFKIENKTLSVHLQRIQGTEDCNGDGSPSSPDQHRSHESRGDQGRKQSLLDTTCHTRRRSKRKTACDSNADFQKLPKIESRYECHVCGKGFKDKKTCGYHIKRHNRVTCPICQINISSNSLRRHMLIHTGEKLFSCNVCEKAFSRHDHLKNHIIGHTRNKPTYTCSTCGKQFGLKRVLQRHQKIHTGEKSPLERPKKIHTGEKSHSERRKKMNAGEKSLSERHKKINTGEKSLSERRKKIHTGEQSLSERRKKIHTGEKSHHFPISRKGFNHSSKLNASKMKIQPTFCPICQKYLYSHFKRHMLVHSGEKPYGCEFCGKHYGRSEHLKKHICE